MTHSSDWQSLLNYWGLPIPHNHHCRLFEQAFTHRSFGSNGQKHNERLEFLGDAVLELIVTEALFRDFPHHPEGELTSYRSSLVCRETLADLARELGLPPYLRLSRSEEASGGREKDYLLANLSEAFLGTLYLVYGLDAVREILQQTLFPKLSEILRQRKHIDSKSELQEITQGTLGITPEYRVLQEHGQDHDKIFVIGVYLKEKQIGQGQGSSKKEAQTKAAAAALLDQKKWN